MAEVIGADGCLDCLMRNVAVNILLRRFLEWASRRLSDEHSPDGSRRVLWRREFFAGAAPVEQRVRGKHCPFRSKFAVSDK